LSPATPERLAAERAVLARRLQRNNGTLTSDAIKRMEEQLPWFAALPARERASVGTLAQLGVTSFVDWFIGQADSSNLTEKIFSSAPRELADALTLEQTVDLVRTVFNVVEDSVSAIAGDNSVRQTALRESLLRYSSEVAFAAANVYARRAEYRGAWDARLQSQLLESILAGDEQDILEARASAAAFKLDGGAIITLIGPAPARRSAAEVHATQIQRTAEQLKFDAIVGLQSDRLIAVISGIPNEMPQGQAAKPFIGHFDQGSIVVGPKVTSLSQVHDSVIDAISAYRALPLAGTSQRLLLSQELVAARVINGDTDAADRIAELLRAQVSPDVLATLANYLESSGTIEACARELFIHVNTVRYRLKRVTEVTGLDPFDPTDSLTLRLGLMYARKLGSL
jgi:hypothetical protein